MNRLTIALAYYENPVMLREQQRIIGAWPEAIRERTRLIVIDDGSPEDPAHKAALEPKGYALEVYRITVDRPWGQLGARNLGMHVAPAGSWVLATDIDHIMPEESAWRLLELEPVDRHYYTFARRMPDGSPTNSHPNSYLMQREWFWEDVGGCDEAFVGWYGTDSIFRNRAAMCGWKVDLPAHLVVYNRDGRDIGGVEGAATRAWGRKRTRWHAKGNEAVKRRMSKAHLRRAEKVLAFEWAKVL